VPISDIANKLKDYITAAVAGNNPAWRVHENINRSAGLEPNAKTPSMDVLAPEQEWVRSKLKSIGFNDNDQELLSMLSGLAGNIPGTAQAGMVPYGKSGDKLRRVLIDNLTNAFTRAAPGGERYEGDAVLKKNITQALANFMSVKYPKLTSRTPIEVMNPTNQRLHPNLTGAFSSADKPGDREFIMVRPGSKSPTMDQIVSNLETMAHELGHSVSGRGLQNNPFQVFRAESDKLHPQGSLARGNNFDTSGYISGSVNKFPAGMSDASKELLRDAKFASYFSQPEEQLANKVGKLGPALIDKLFTPPKEQSRVFDAGERATLDHPFVKELRSTGDLSSFWEGYLNRGNSDALLGNLVTPSAFKGNYKHLYDEVRPWSNAGNWSKEYLDTIFHKGKYLSAPVDKLKAAVLEKYKRMNPVPSQKNPEVFDYIGNGIYKIPIEQPTNTNDRPGLPDDDFQAIIDMYRNLPRK